MNVLVVTESTETMKRGGTREFQLNNIYNYLIKKSDLHGEDQRCMYNFGQKTWTEERELSEFVFLEKRLRLKWILSHVGGVSWIDMGGRQWQ
jgi:hypothetical protein